MSEALSKGLLLEELLRHYFIRSGYFTVRAVPFVYDGVEVTDLDLWLYERPSSVSRHRIIVDSKNRSTPKAIERIFWIKGLQKVVGAEQSIVATTDKRASVGVFGKENDVVVLDGTFLARLQKSLDRFDERLTEEMFVDLLGSYRATKESGDWKNRLKAAKQHFARDLGYNAINVWLEDARFFAEQVRLVSTHREVALRMVYLIASYISIAFDFAMRDLAFAESPSKQAAINDGLKYGSRGAAAGRQLIDLATGLVEQYAPEHRTLAPQIRARINQELDSIPTAILAEHFSKAPVVQELFPVAKELEGAAYNRTFVAPASLSPNAKATLGALLDFLGVERTVVFQYAPESGSSTDATVPAASSTVRKGQEALPGIGGEE